MALFTEENGIIENNFVAKILAVEFCLFAFKCL